jgi:sugar transferase (PEP-CTERM system associated)
MIKIGGQRISTQSLVWIGVDVAAILIALCLAIATRFLHWDAILLYLKQPATIYRIVVPLVACELALYYHDVYNPEAVRRFAELVARLFQSLGTVCLALAVLYYTDPNHSLGRGIAVLALPIIFVLLLGWRIILGHKGIQLSEPHRVLVVGTGAPGIALVREIISRPDLNLKVVGFLDERGENIGKSLVNPGIIGAVANLQEIAMRERADRVVLSLAERRGNTPVRELLDLKFAGVGVEDVHTVWEEISGRIHLQHLSPSWLILSDGFRKSRLLLAVKRAFDFLVALLGLVIVSPIMILTVIAVWVETGSPVLFRQERTGMRGRPFQILKFRSMRQDAESDGAQWAVDGDERVTRVGRIIRKLRFDEFPQFINVLRGEMSLVGPRPERPVFCELLEREIPLYAQRRSVRPGITGWAQVKYQYGASVEESRTKLEYDLFYIKHMSTMLDLAIIFETFKVLFTGRGAK